jgi:hypothetical protein
MSDARDYPLPAYAMYVWHRGDAVVLAGNEGHTIVIPLDKLAVGSGADQRGWTILLDILRDRSRAYAARRPARIGTNEAPVRAQIEALLAGQRERAYGARSTEIDEDIFAEHVTRSTEDVA